MSHLGFQLHGTAIFDIAIHSYINLKRLATDKGVDQLLSDTVSFMVPIRAHTLEKPSPWHPIT